MDALAAAEAKAERAVEKKTKAEQAITWLAELYQPVDVINTTPHPTDYAFEVCEARRLSQVGGLLLVEEEMPMVPASSKCPASYSDNNNIHNPTPFKHVKETTLVTELARPSTMLQLKALATTSLSMLDDSDGGTLAQATREKAVKAKALQVHGDKKGNKVVDKTLKAVEKVKKVSKEVAKAEKEKEGKATNQALEKSGNEIENTKKKHTLKKPVSEIQSLHSTEDPTIKIKIEKKPKQDSGTCDAIRNAYNAWHAEIAMSSSRDVIEMADDPLDAEGKENKKGKVSAPVKSMDVWVSPSTLLSTSDDQAHSDGKKVMVSNGHIQEQKSLTFMSQCLC